ncbi:MAG: S9 family peptidase [Acidobacteria bacterium]|nr:S9 family peptidase [Acidobacteriota bacterium]
MSHTTNLSRRKLFFGVIFSAIFTFQVFGQNAPPKAEVRNVTDEYFGQKIADPYRWMENFKDPEVQTWIKAQADYAASMLKAIPGRDALLERIKALDSGAPFRIYYFNRRQDGTLFYLKQGVTENVPKLYVRNGKTGKETLLVDPDKRVTNDGKHYSLQFYTPSPDGKYIVYGLAEGGSEQTTVYILETATGRDLSESIDRIEPYYTVPAWLADGSGFYYVRLQKVAPDMPPTEGYKNSRVYFHKLGTDPEKDIFTLGIGSSSLVKLESADFPGIFTFKNSSFAIGQIKHGDAGELTLYAAPVETVGKPNTPWKKICDVEDAVTQFAVNGSDVYLKTSKNAPRFKVVLTSLANPDFEQAAVIMPAGEAIVDDVRIAKSAVYITALEDGLNHIFRVDLSPGSQPERLELPNGSTGYIISANPQFEDVWVLSSSWTKGGSVYSYNPRTNKFTDTALQPKGKFDDLPGYESVELKVKSHDGVLVPLSIIYKKGIKLDGTNPTLMSGYGSYGAIEYVYFAPITLAWLERGGVLAVAHVRGGGEYGEDWRKAGYKQTKPNTWKDFIACAEYLIAKKYTSSKHLAGLSGSAGGILIGRAITERPELFGAAVIQVGATDMLRMETTTNGVPNIQEFGTVKTEEGFRALYEMSALHHVKDGVKYPAVLLTHGINDPRVEPWMSAKMAARLQAATASGKPVLLRIDYDAGHGIGSTKSQFYEEVADTYAFLFQQLK